MDNGTRWPRISQELARYNPYIHSSLRYTRRPKIEIILRKNQNGFQKNRSTTSQILTICRILEGVRAKNLEATILFVNFTKAFDYIHNGANSSRLPKETVAAIMMLYRSTKVKVRSPDGDTDYFDIVAGLLQGEILAPYLFIISLDYVLRTSIDKMKHANKGKEQKVPSTNNYGRRLRRWCSASGKCTRPRRYLVT